MEKKNNRPIFAKLRLRFVNIQTAQIRYLKRTILLTTRNLHLITLINL